jgi:hypothetical protein
MALASLTTKPGRPRVSFKTSRSRNLFTVQGTPFKSLNAAIAVCVPELTAAWKGRRYKL